MGYPNIPELGREWDQPPLLQFRSVAEGDYKYNPDFIKTMLSALERRLRQTGEVKVRGPWYSGRYFRVIVSLPEYCTSCGALQQNKEYKLWFTLSGGTWVKS